MRCLECRSMVSWDAPLYVFFLQRVQSPGSETLSVSRFVWVGSCWEWFNTARYDVCVKRYQSHLLDESVSFFEINIHHTAKPNPHHKLIRLANATVLLQLENVCLLPRTRKSTTQFSEKLLQTRGSAKDCPRPCTSETVANPFGNTKGS